MAVSTLTSKGQIVIPAEIRARHELTPGTQVEFVDDGGVIRLLVRRQRIAPADPAAGYGMLRIAAPARKVASRRLSEFDAAGLLKRRRTGK